MILNGSKVTLVRIVGGDISGGNSDATTLRVVATLGMAVDGVVMNAAEAELVEFDVTQADAAGQIAAAQVSVAAKGYPAISEASIARILEALQAQQQ